MKAEPSSRLIPRKLTASLELVADVIEFELLAPPFDGKTYHIINKFIKKNQ